MKQFIIISTCFLTTLITGLTSCTKKTDEGELITTIKLRLKSGTTDTTFIWNDPDGAVGNAPVQIDTIRLDSGLLYTAEISVLNESVTPSEDITEEIRNEGSSHILCYTATPALVAVTSKDSDGKYSIGLKTEWSTLFKGEGQIRVLLKHQPGSKDGSCDPGETDIDVVFPVEVE